MIPRLVGLVAAAVLLGATILLFAEPVLAGCGTGGC
jgi:hypothetical protein